MLGLSGFELYSRWVPLTKRCVVHTEATCIRVEQVELHGTRRGDNITPKLVLRNYESIISHQGTCRWNISLKHVPSTFSCVCIYCDFVLPTRPRCTSLLHVFSV